MALQRLWTDAPRSEDRLVELRRRALIDDEDANRLRHFAEHGWFTIERGVEAELVDELVWDVRNHHRYAGLFLATDHRHGAAMKVTGSEPDSYESLFDLYVNLPSSRNVCLHPGIMRLLRLVFEAEPLAFQQLLFQRSNGHPAHQDTAFVAVEEPCLMAATWIALEDIREGSGELAYYDGSHRLPDHAFKDGGKRFVTGADDAVKYSADLVAACERLGMPYRRFLAKKGDVFVWAADLVHASHPRSLPEETSRMACVTHYCPMTTRPFYFRLFPEHRAIERYGGLGAVASSYYALPTRGRVVRPSRMA